MRWDYASAVVWGIDQKGPDGVDMFGRACAELAKKLGADIEQGDPLNGYQMGVKIVRAGDLLLRCMTAGTGSAVGSSQFISASTASEVYPIIQELFPRHSISRLDAAEDYIGEGVWNNLESMLTNICVKHRVSMSPFGEGHFRPDGTRDSTKGRSWYCGSKSSPFRIILYEKGLEKLAKGIPSDPNWVRLEVRVKPSSKAKSFLGSAGLKPVDLLGMSRWGKDVADAMGVRDLERISIGTVWKPNEQESMALKVVRMFDRGIEKLIEETGSPEAMGRLLSDVMKKARQAKGSLKAVKA